jgi:hypothetical protein
MESTIGAVLLNYTVLFVLLICATAKFMGALIANCFNNGFYMDVLLAGAP